MSITRALLIAVGFFMLGSVLYSAKAEQKCGPITELPDVEVAAVMRWIDAAGQKVQLYTDRQHNVYILQHPTPSTYCLVHRGNNLQVREEFFQSSDAEL